MTESCWKTCISLINQATKRFHAYRIHNIQKKYTRGTYTYKRCASTFLRDRSNVTLLANIFAHPDETSHIFLSDLLLHIFDSTNPLKRFNRFIYNFWYFSYLQNADNFTISKFYNIVEGLNGFEFGSFDQFVKIKDMDLSDLDHINMKDLYKRVNFIFKCVQ